MPDALSLSRSELPEEIATAIEELEAAAWRHGFERRMQSSDKASRSALTAAILSRLGEAAQGAPFGTGYSRAEPSGLGPEAEYPSRSPDHRPGSVLTRSHLRIYRQIANETTGAFMAPADVGSLLDEIDRLEAENARLREEWAQEGIGWLRDKDIDRLMGVEDENKRLMAEVERLRDELAMAKGANRALEEWIRGHRIIGRPDAMTAQGIEAEGRNTEGGSVHESPVAEGHAPDLTEAGRLAIKDA